MPVDGMPLEVGPLGVLGRLSPELSPSFGACCGTSTCMYDAKLGWQKATDELEQLDDVSRRAAGGLQAARGALGALLK